MCFAFFFFYAIVISVVQAFAPEAARQLHGVPLALSGDVPHGVHGVQRMRHGAGGLSGVGPFALRAHRGPGLWRGGDVGALTLALARLPVLAVPVLFGVMGFASGIAGPSRDLLVKKSTPENATGRVYGVVYSGLDIGQAAAPLVFGALMDHAALHAAVLLGLALVQGLLIASAFNVRRVRRTALAAT
jgi:FSR family fosmidomycin resistance protein-like MFS transporter